MLYKITFQRIHSYRELAMSDSDDFIDTGNFIFPSLPVKMVPLPKRQKKKREKLKQKITPSFPCPPLDIPMQDFNFIPAAKK